MCAIARVASSPRANIQLPSPRKDTLCSGAAERASASKREREREDAALLRSRRALQAQSAHFLRFWPPAQPQHPHHQSLKNNAEAPLRTQEKTLTLFALAPELFQRKYFVSVSIHKHFLAAFLHISYIYRETERSAACAFIKWHGFWTHFRDAGGKWRGGREF